MTEARFLRSKALRNALWIAAEGKCQMCGCDLPEDWHADHIVSWTETRQTNVHEMQALCPACNLKKGARMAFKDRQHQADLKERISRVDASDFPLKILAWVVPGGGKSRLPGILAEKFRNHKIGWFVPRLSLQEQAVEDMQRNFGIELRDAGNDTDPTRGKRGFVATHDALATNPDLWQHELRRFPYVLVVDESHHAKIDREGNLRPVARALSKLRADVWLNMTGTLETNDGTMIWGMEYDTVDDGIQINPERSAHIYIRYSRPTALNDQGALCPIEFHHHDGPIRWKPGANPERSERISEVDRKDEGAAIFTALRTELAIQLFDGGLSHWRKHSRGKLIVVVDRQENARKYAKFLKSAGLTAALAIDDNPDARAEIKRFRRDPMVQALVTCQMAYEGLDAPETSHIICLTHIRSVPWIEQMLARAWRGGKPQCWAFVPDDPRMNRVIERIAKEQPDVLREGNGGGGGGGPGPESVLAIDGLVDAVERKFLDDGFAADETEEKVVQFLKGFGLTGSEPEVVALLHRLKRPAVPEVNSRTPAQREQALRNQIADECRDIDRINGQRYGKPPQWGEAQGRLIRVTRKSITDMGEEELKRAYEALQSLRPR